MQQYFHLCNENKRNLCTRNEESNVWRCHLPIKKLALHKVCTFGVKRFTAGSSRWIFQEFRSRAVWTAGHRVCATDMYKCHPPNRAKFFARKNEVEICWPLLISYRSEDPIRKLFENGIFPGHQISITFFLEIFIPQFCAWHLYIWHFFTRYLSHFTK